MNHATWSLGTVSTQSWRPGASTQRPPRPGSTSPRKDRRISGKKSHLDSGRPRSSDASPHQQSSPVADHHDRSHAYHYISSNNVRSPLTPPCSNQRKKGEKRREAIMADEKAMSKSPSAPNLHATATSMLALQGSLAGFTAMAVGKDISSNKNKKADSPTASSGKNQVVANTQKSSSHRSNETSASKAVTPRAQDQSPCTCRHTTMSPTPRVIMNAHIPKEDSSFNSPHTWNQRRPPSEESAKQLLLPNKAHIKSYVFKETSV